LSASSAYRSVSWRLPRPETSAEEEPFKTIASCFGKATRPTGRWNAGTSRPVHPVIYIGFLTAAGRCSLAAGIARRGVAQRTTLDTTILKGQLHLALVAKALREAQVLPTVLLPLDSGLCNGMAGADAFFVRHLLSELSNVGLNDPLWTFLGCCEELAYAVIDGPPAISESLVLPGNPITGLLHTREWLAVASSTAGAANELHELACIVDSNPPPPPRGALLAPT